MVSEVPEKWECSVAKFQQFKLCTDSVQGAKHRSEFDRGGVAVSSASSDENGFISADESRRVLTSLIESTGEDEMIPKIPPESTEEERPSF